MTSFPGTGTVPGITAAVLTTEKHIWFGKDEQQLRQSAELKSTTVDAGNTPTTQLRPGLILGVITATGLYEEYDPDATDGTEVARAVLVDPVNMLDGSGTAVARHVSVLIHGFLKAGQLLLLDDQARNQLGGAGFHFDDDMAGRAGFLGQPIRNLNVTGDTTVTAAQNGTRFIATAADATFTLPTIAVGLIYEFLRASDHEMVVISVGLDDMIFGHDIAADSITFTTAGKQIGAMVRVEAIFVGTTLRWLTSLASTPFGTGLTGGFAYSIAT